jgi:hypothetical protein
MSRAILRENAHPPDDARKPHRPDSPRLGHCVLHVFRFPTGNTRSRVFSNQLSLGKLSTALDLTVAQRP